MLRFCVFAYGVAAYIVFLMTFLYALGFIGNFAVPKSMDSPADTPFQTALAVDLALLTVFALQHSVMARPAFKRLLTRFVPHAAERSTYVLASCAAMGLMFWQWQPLGGVVWDVQSEAGRMMLYVGFAFGWTLVLVTTFVINHFDLFGLRQVWRNLMGRPVDTPAFVMPLLYRVVRHPLYVGWLLAFWCAPTMTATHLLFATMTTAYILVAIRFEERDLMRVHPEYASYRRQVPMLIPSLPRQVGHVTERASTLGIIALAAALAAPAQGQTLSLPSVPANIQVPAGHSAYLKASATGTQNYVCLPSASGLAWKFQGPQATLFVTVKWGATEIRQQVATHFLSPNPMEAGTPRATWQGSFDTSSVWAKKIAESSDPAFVLPGAIPWFLLQVVGGQSGPQGGTLFSNASYLQRVNTTGGIAPAGACTEAGALQFVPYTADYIFYRPSSR